MVICSLAHEIIILTSTVLVHPPCHSHCLKVDVLGLKMDPNVAPDDFFFFFFNFVPRIKVFLLLFIKTMVIRIKIANYSNPELWAKVNCSENIFGGIKPSAFYY